LVALEIENNPNLINLERLSSIGLINGGYDGRLAHLFIRNNALLSDIDGLSSLTTVTAVFDADIDISNNPSLKNINGLFSLSRMERHREGTISITNNSALTNIDCLSALDLSDNWLPQKLTLAITNNAQLTNCSALETVFGTLGTEVVKELAESGNLNISDNGIGCTLEDVLPGDSPEVCVGNVTLTTQAEVDAFNCTMVGGVLRISGNDITNLDALTMLERVGEGLIIENNHNLINPNGLSSLDSIDGGPNKQWI
jgi:hypothetical protein